jgi:hypothetical protein
VAGADRKPRKAAQILTPSRARKPKASKAKKAVKKGPVKLYCGKCTFTYVGGFVFKCKGHLQWVEDMRAERIAKCKVPFLLWPGRAELDRAAREREQAISQIKTPRGWTKIGITTEGVLFGRGKGKRRKFQTIPLTK